MKTDFYYSTDFLQMNHPQLGHTCMHLLCLEGEGSFVFNEHCYHIVPNDLVVMEHPNRACNLAAHPELRVEWFAGDLKFMQNQLPSNNYSIGGSITLYRNPVIPLGADDVQRIRSDFQCLRERMDQHQLQFHREMMGSLCLTLMYDIFEAHARRDATQVHSDRAAFIVKQFFALLATGVSSTEREVGYYAERLGVSVKYLSVTIKRVTGKTITSYIDQHTVPLLKQLLNDERLSLTQIAERMRFNSLSYFSRYCTKHLGQTPSAYRRSLQPR